jgi:hypothetical protein
MSQFSPKGGIVRASQFVVVLLVILGLVLSASAQSSTEWAVHAANRYQVFPNLTYLTASNFEAKLDIYKRRDTTVRSRLSFTCTGDSGRPAPKRVL